MSEKRRLCATAVIFAVFTLALLWPEADGASMRASDGDQYERIAFNMVRYGRYHVSPRLTETSDAGPYFRREPGYPLFLATVFALSPEFPSLTHACISDGRCAAAAPVRRRVQWLTSLIQAMTVAATFLVAYTWTGSWLVSIAAGLFYLVLLPPLDTSIVLAAFLLFVHAVLAAETWRKPRLVTAVISGLALGLLVLTKAVFQYWLVGVALLWITGLWWDGPRRRALLPAAMALLIGAGILTLPWMVRNAVQVGHFGISGRSGELLAIRTEYGRMTWSEVRGAFAFYLPMNGALRDRAMRWLEPEVFGYRRFDRSRSNLAGFYRRTKRETGEVAARADRLDPGWRQRVGEWGLGRDDVLARASAELLREDWLKQAVLTLAFLERGSFFPIRHYDRFHGAADDASKRLLWFPMTLIQSLAWLLRYLLLPAVGIMAVVAWRRRSFELGFLVLPVIYVFGIHAVATHFESRYSHPSVVLLVLIFSVAAQEVWLCFRKLPRQVDTSKGDCVGRQGMVG